jgi:hypothetical protein
MLGIVQPSYVLILEVLLKRLSRLLVGYHLAACIQQPLHQRLILAGYPPLFELLKASILVHHKRWFLNCGLD